MFLLFYLQLFGRFPTGQAIRYNLLAPSVAKRIFAAILNATKSITFYFQLSSLSN